jgi:NhaP-type Na+/H+ or K+/H+ antiporter
VTQQYNWDTHMERERRHERFWHAVWSITKALVFVLLGVVGTLLWTGTGK